MFGSASEEPAPSQPETPSDALKTRRRRSQVLLMVGLYSIPIGAVFEYLSPVATLTCGPPASQKAACVVTERVLFGTLTTGTEAIELRGARVVGRITRRQQLRNSVILDTAAGDHTMTVTGSSTAAEVLVHTINERVRTGTAPFDVSLGFTLGDWFVRTFAKLLVVAGVAIAIAGAIGVRRANRDGATNQSAANVSLE